MSADSECHLADGSCYSYNILITVAGSFVFLFFIFCNMVVCIYNVFRTFYCCRG